MEAETQLTVAPCSVRQARPRSEEVQSEQLILTPVLQVKPELHVSWDALLKPRTPSKVVHTLTNMDVVKAAGVTRRKHDLAR